MRSLLWKTFGLTAPILLGLIGFSSPSEGLVGGGRVAVSVCGDSAPLSCSSNRPRDSCKDGSKWVNADADPTPDDVFVPKDLVDCREKNSGTECNGAAYAPYWHLDCKNLVPVMP
jgi:hypothetical protein